MFGTPSCAGDFSCFLPKRGALRRQACVEQSSQEQHQDPWVRLSNSSSKELPEVHQHQQPANSTKSVSVHNIPATMSEEESTLEHNGTATDVTSDSPPENTSDSSLESKKGPPVAPKPAWFRQSLRKIRDEQTKTSEPRPATGFGRSPGVRSASATAGLSIKQKISSFETFSSPGSPEKGVDRRLVAPSSSLPMMEKERQSPCPSYPGKGKLEFHQEVQSDRSGSVNEADNPPLPTATTLATEETCSQNTASEDEPHCIQFNDLTISTDLRSGLTDSNPASDLDDNKVSTTKEELKSEDISRSTERATPMTSKQTEGEGTSEQTEEEGAQGNGKLRRTTHRAAPPTEKGQEGESLERIIAFSNQVIYHRCEKRRCLNCVWFAFILTAKSLNNQTQYCACVEYFNRL